MLRQRDEERWSQKQGTIFTSHTSYMTGVPSTSYQNKPVIYKVNHLWGSLVAFMASLRTIELVALKGKGKRYL